MLQSDHKVLLHFIAYACFNNAVGVADPGIVPDIQMSASTQRSGTEAIFGRLNENRNNGKGWCALNCCGSQEWLQVDVGQTTEICGVATHGNKIYSRFVIDFKLSFSSDESNWNTYKDTGGSDKVRFYLHYKCLHLLMPLECAEGCL